MASEGRGAREATEDARGARAVGTGPGGLTTASPGSPGRAPGRDGWAGTERARCKSPICGLLGSLGSAAGELVFLDKHS